MTPEPKDKLDAATTVVVNGPEDDPLEPNGSYGLASPDLEGLLEPDAGRLARPVPRGARPSNGPGLPVRICAGSPCQAFHLIVGGGPRV
jgi:hypothetical protein